MSEPMKVRDRLVREYRLNVLRITMETVDGNPLALLTLTLGDAGEVAMLTASLPEFGFDAEHLDLLPETFSMPPHIIAALRAWLRPGGGTTARPLWLRLSVPLGWLAAMPWEELLQRELNVAILRLPYQAICPRVPASNIDTLMCFSSPMEEEYLGKRFDAFINQVPVDLARTTRFHLFAGCTLQPKLLELQAKYQGSIRIAVYSLPPDSLDVNASAPVNPWLAWIREAMGEGSVDVVHFVCHGTHRSQVGALMLAASPIADADPDNACLVCAPEFVDLLDYLGAWCVAFTSAPAERSAAGMRLLQTEIALRRPGPVLVHDMNVRGSRQALDAAYRFLFTPSLAPPAAPAVSLYCHPVMMSRVGTDPESVSQLQKFTLAGELDTSADDRSMPHWLKSSQRKLEASAVRLAEAEGDVGTAGRLRARSLVLGAAADYAKELSADSAAAAKEP